MVHKNKKLYGGFWNVIYINILQRESFSGSYSRFSPKAYFEAEDSVTPVGHFGFHLRTLLICSCILISLVSAKESLWREDVSRKMHVGVATSSYERIVLKCLPDSMELVIVTDKDFDGVIYTRGSFYTRPENCFLKAAKGRHFKLNLPLDECGIKQEDDIYTAMVVLQHDEELVMPGDVAFRLKCDYAPKDVSVGSSYSISNKPVLSSISLADPDPSGKDLPRHLQSTVTNLTSVVFRPSDIRPKRKPKEEL